MLMTFVDELIEFADGWLYNILIQQTADNEFRFEAFASAKWVWPPKWFDFNTQSVRRLKARSERLI